MAILTVVPAMISLCTSRRNLISFGYVTPEITTLDILTKLTSGTIWQHWHIPSNILECTGPRIFTKFPEFVDIRVGMINLTFVLWLQKGRY